MATLTLAICARNAQSIIGECLNSINTQTVRPDEVLVAVDDLSDPTAAVAEAAGARVIASNATGLYEARNAVLAACHTDYLAFTDADCVLVPRWVELVHEVFKEHPDVAAGTGRHPPVGTRNFASWLHHMWFVVETQHTGYTDGVIGGNSYFRAAALREVGGWLKLPRHSAAEDVYMSRALRNRGYKIWFEADAAAQHNYETHLGGLWRKSVMMGRDIVVMLRAAGWYDSLFWYTMAIPVLALTLVTGCASLFVLPWLGATLIAAPLALTFGYLAQKFHCTKTALPRWAARWVLIWPYAWGIVQGLVTPLPKTRIKELNETAHVADRT